MRRSFFHYSLFKVCGDENTPTISDDAGNADVLIRVQIAGCDTAERDHNRRGTSTN